MALGTVTENNYTTDGTEQTVCDDSAGGIYQLLLGLENMVASDVLEVRAYRKIRTVTPGSNYELAAAVVTYTGAQTVDHVNPFPEIWAPRGIKYTIKRTASGAGGDKVYPVLVAKIS